MIEYPFFGGGCYIDSNIIESTFKIRKMSIIQFRLSHLIVNSIVLLSISTNNFNEKVIWSIIEGKEDNNPYRDKLNERGKDLYIEGLDYFLNHVK